MPLSPAAISSDLSSAKGRGTTILNGSKKVKGCQTSGPFREALETNRDSGRIVRKLSDCRHVRLVRQVRQLRHVRQPLLLLLILLQQYFY